MVSPPTPPIDDILTYYLAVLRHEEALQSRLRVYSPGRGVHVTNLVEPGFGSRYAKLPMGPDPSTDPVFDLLFRKEGVFDFPFAGDFPPLFENWLRNTYFRERRTTMGGGEDNDTTFMVGFPTVFFPTRGEIDLVLRFPIAALEFRDEAHKPWLPLSYSERKKGVVRPLPTSVGLVGEGWDPSEPAYAVHTQLLSRTFGISEEDLADVFAEDRQTRLPEPGQMIRKLIGLLRNPEAPLTACPPEQEPAALFKLLCEQLQNRTLPGGARVFPVAVVYDGNQSAATRGLQTELRTLRDRRDDVGTSTPFSVVLAGADFHQGRETLKGQHKDTELTPEQVEALEIFRDSEFVAVQGPPGTGKTTLVMSALADAMVDWAKSLKGNGGVPLFRISVVTSTNNRAVDNAIQPLSLHLPADRLPLALRIGSQEVTATVTMATIQRVVDWLKRTDETYSQAEQRYHDARRTFQDALHFQGSKDDPIEQAYTLRTELEWASSTLENLIRRIEQSDGEPDLSVQLSRLEDEIRTARQLSSLGRQVDERSCVLAERNRRGGAAPASKKQKETLRTFLDTKFLPLQDQWLEFLREIGETKLPEKRIGGVDVFTSTFSKDDVLELLDEVDDQLTTLLSDLDTRVKTAVRRVTRLQREIHDREQKTVLQTKVEQLQAAVANLPDSDRLFREGAKRRYRLFELACRLREAWVSLHRREIEALCERTKDMISQRKTVRPLLEKDDGTMLSLGHLFPLLGCTLLSFSNAFGLRKDVISQLIVDEAGQCHPAYILPALARSRRAMVIGDVFQLEPVIQLDEEEETRALRRAKCPSATPQLHPFRALAENPTSAQTLANRVCERVISLKEHYRCQPQIIGISDRLCNYGLRVKTTPKSYVERVPELVSPVILVPVSGTQERGHGSWRNMAEVERAAQIVAGLVNRGIPHEEIAVLTPYRGQLLALRRRLFGLFGGHEARAGADEVDLESFLERGIALGTVHRFQGGERDIVLFSTTITHPRSLFFLNDRVNLVNVAVSRAKAHLIVLGNPHVLSQGQVTRELVTQVGTKWPETSSGLLL